MTKYYGINLFYVLKNIARCLSNSSKELNRHENALPLPEAGLPLRSRAIYSYHASVF